METRLGQVAPLVMVTEAIPSRLPLLSWRWKRVPRDPMRTPDVSSCPEWTSASKASPRRTSCSCGLSCSCIQPRRAPDTHLTTPWIVFFWGGGGGSRAPAGVAGPSGRMGTKTTCHHGPQSSTLRHGLLLCVSSWRPLSCLCLS